VRARRRTYRLFIQRNGEPCLHLQTWSIKKLLEEARYLLEEAGERIVYLERVD